MAGSRKVRRTVKAVCAFKGEGLLHSRSFNGFRFELLAVSFFK